ncbi:MAG: archease [Thermoplasmata archaeon]|nr:MAG: archease [Thermoplasmata archaeon]
MKKYEILEHTADVGIRANGKDLSEAFENAAYGMFSIITNIEEVEEIGEYQIHIQSRDLEQLLVDWLSELLFIHTVKNVLFSKFEIEIEEKEGSWLLRGSAKGENYNKDKHAYHTEMKAVTHHILKIEKSDGYTVQVLFDI